MLWLETPSCTLCRHKTTSLKQWTRAQFDSTADTDIGNLSTKILWCNQRKQEIADLLAAEISNFSSAIQNKPPKSKEDRMDKGTPLTKLHDTEESFWHKGIHVSGYDIAYGAECLKMLIKFQQVLDEHYVKWGHGSIGFNLFWEKRTNLLSTTSSHPRIQKSRTRKLNKMLAMDVVEPSQTELVSKIVFAPTKYRKLRFCLHYCKQNVITIPNQYVIPCMNECTYSLGNATIFSKLHANSGYQQMEIVNVECSKTALTSHHRQLWYIRM